MKSVNSLKITVLMDDAVPGNTDLVAQHGASFFLEIEAEKDKMCVLVDVGQSSKALFHNMNKLHIDPESIDILILTHCHYDHTGALVDLLRASKKKDLPVIAHPTLFRPHFACKPVISYIGVPQGNGPLEIESAGGKLLLSKDPVQLREGVIVLGEIPRKTDFEEPSINAITIEEGRVKKDMLFDDTALAVNVEGHGIVIVTGCSHSGIVNIALRAKDIFPGIPIEGILGGFHLKDVDPECIEKTVSRLASLKPSWIAAGHCTGFDAMVAFKNYFGDDFTPLHVGKTVTIPKS